MNASVLDSSTSMSGSLFSDRATLLHVHIQDCTVFVIVSKEILKIDDDRDV